ncbi:hypothetical protein [Ectopseudomonas oleovorans]|uniref:Uncharacterized protein n=1 Tax=Ectopseudomonas oleovorans TaxID=301 RepID=A0AA42Q9S6_ECTOL|nr:hypothetical protein [Pseudomonas oleovorans]MDH1339800.1 hypothetical protein [Pseudomonas oleovorans]MDH1492650.1 hypothetical protein [Pseudomonas oleovorans]WGG21673.1 hypothetical protein N5O83_02950 [Pseudomonas oleovorans]
MATANVIPLSAKIAAEISIQHALPMCTVLTPDLADKLRALNDMTRRLRAAGVRVKSASPLDGKIFINAEDSDQLAASFKHEWRGVSWSTKGVHTINSVRLGGCYVCWLTPAKGLPS